MPTTEDRRIETSWDLLLKSLCELDTDEEGRDAGFARALEMAPRLLASSGLLPMNVTSEKYNEAIDQVMSD
jgi:hypothetical protein